ncbi:MAG: histidine kinase [Actinomycetota bacterium]|nr:histidine kinase [Actinomycetota bacterium]
MDRKTASILFFGLFALALLSAWAWLILGALPLLAAMAESIHDGLHRRGAGVDVAGEVARNAAQAAHGVQVSMQSLFDYLFSFFNLGLAIFLLKLRPYDRTARLLSLGMVGTALAFNLQGHDAQQVVPVSWLGVVAAGHVIVHVASGLCYMFALLLFPHGRIAATRKKALLRLPLLIPLALFFTMVSLFSVDDHTLGLVLVYGIFIPVAGIAAQGVRFFTARDHEQRQQSKVLLFALLVSIAVALPLVLLTQTPTAGAQRTVEYEVTAPGPGTYFFRCDPHPEDMTGVVTVVQPQPGTDNSVVEIAAQDSRFDKPVLTLEADERSVISFTNKDGDLHNVAIYETAAAEKPIFIGQEFSGHQTAAVAFRVFRVVFAVIPIALFVGLIRFRLWDIDRVMNRTLVYGAVLGIITLVYLAAVVGIETTIGAGRRLNLAVSVAVTVALAAAFQPLRDRARKVANRIVYGKRATPYEVLSELSERVGNAYAAEDAIPQMARALAEGTAARSAGVWLRVGDRLVLSASWPEPAGDATPVPLNGSQLPEFTGASRAVAVSHQGELLGALTIDTTPGQPPTPIEERLLQDIAAQAGLLLRNAQLTAELHARLEQLRESRQRIVAAQDAERRRLERNIHDGAQQHLVALSMKLRLAQDLADRDPARARALLEELQGDTSSALQTLRDLARGIYPPVLADKGLVQALEAHARRCPVEVTVSEDGVGRHGSDVEAAVYFFCLEAIQNAIKHVGRGPIEVTLHQSEGTLHVAVRDPGPGFDVSTRSYGTGIQNMSDRLAALGGHLSVTSSPTGPTVVEGSVPIADEQVSSRSQVQATPN